MLKRLYIDNYRCLSNFTWEPGPRVLLVGPNGSGKSAVLEVLWTLQQFLVHQHTTESLFPPRHLTAWDRRDKQTFELDIESSGQLYQYRLVVEHERTRNRSRVFQESLKVQDATLYEYRDQEAHLFRDDGSTGPSFPTDWSRSLISTLPERPDNQSLTQFRNRMRHIYRFALEPWNMKSRSEREERDPGVGLSNIASWVRHLQAEDSSFPNRLNEALRPMFPGFSHYGLKSGSGDTRNLCFEFEAPRTETADYEIPFEELSDGQRALTALYVILNAIIKRDTTICFDEPDNYISLREIQPWLLELQERQEDAGCQCILVSHHPELIDMLTPMRETILLERDNGGVVRIKNVDWSEGDGVPASEIMARGW